MHPADAADIIEQLSENYRENLIKLKEFINSEYRKKKKNKHFLL